MTVIEREIDTHYIDWNGIRIEILFERKWLGGDFRALLQIRSIKPEHCPLPMTETGYIGHFVEAAEIDEAGGPVAYSVAWLERASGYPAWREYEDRRRQLSLF